MIRPRSAKLPRPRLGLGLLLALALSTPDGHAEGLAALDTSAAAAPVPLPGWVRSVRIVRGDEPLLTAPRANAPRRGAARLGAHLPVFAAKPGSGCTELWFHVGPDAWVCGAGVEPSDLPALAVDATPDPPRDGLPYGYYFVDELGALGYRDLQTAEWGPPDLELEPGFAIGIARTAARGADPFGLTAHGFWVPLRDLRPARPSVFRGVSWSPNSPAESPRPEALVWTRHDHVSLHGAPGGRLIRRVARHTPLEAVERRTRGGRGWLSLDGDARGSEWVEETRVARIVPGAPPAELEPDERWIDVDLTQQVLTAYEGERLVFATLISTGRGRGTAEDATPLGEHRIWVKLVASDMNNLEAAEANRYYSMQSVPWVMYFHKGYGLHGAYWHDDFGQRRSHGCVNLSPPDAARLFQWAEPRLPAGWTAILPSRYERGTLVRVRESGARAHGEN